MARAASSSGGLGGTWQIYLKSWDGTSWAELGGSASGGGVSNNATGSRTPSIAYDALGRAVVAWGDDADGDSEVYVRRYDGAAWAQLAGSATGGGVSANGTSSTDPSQSSSMPFPHRSLTPQQLPQEQAPSQARVPSMPPPIGAPPPMPPAAPAPPPPVASGGFSQVPLWKQSRSSGLHAAATSKAITAAAIGFGKTPGVRIASPSQALIRPQTR
jgi:hypothetical protein